MGYHYVPQELLRGFSLLDKPDIVWQFDLQTCRFSEKPIPIKKVAQAREYYEPDVERKLATVVEGPANAVLNRLRGGALIHDLTETERAHLAIYMATLIHRVPRHRARAEALMPDALAKVIEDTKDQLHEVARRLSGPKEVIDHYLAKHLETTDEIHKKFLENPPEEVVKQVERPWPSEEIVDLIYRQNWYLVRSDGSSAFVTSDNPLFMFKCYGIRNPNSEITFPISRDLGLFGTWKPVKRSRSIEVQPRLVRESNRRIISATQRFVFSHSTPDWLPVVAAKEPYLSRIIC